MPSNRKDLEISSDFEGSMLGGYRIEEMKIFIDIKKEKITKGHLKSFNYNHHFHFKVCNKSMEKKILKFYVGCEEGEVLKDTFKHLWISEDPDNTYSLKKISGKMSVPGKYSFELQIMGNQKLFIANYYPIKYSYLIRSIESKADASGGKPVQIGKTVEGRNITSYEYGDVENKPVLMFIAGYHPPEMEPITIDAIMESLEDNEFRNSVLERFSIALIPFVNPDGFANSMQGSNMNEINYHWRFFGNTKDECPECYAIWDYCKKLKPVFFMDFHIFTFQKNEARPYIISPIYYSNRTSRKILRSINSKFRSICSGEFSRSEKILSHNILSSALRNEIGTITSPKFHLHMKDGLDQCKDRSKTVFNSVIDIFTRYDEGQIKDILLIPYGKNKNPFYFIFLIKILEFFNFRIKSKIRF